MVSLTFLVHILFTIVYHYRLFVDGSPFIYTARIRPVSCSSKKTNEIGVCMFAAECFQQNGKHLSPCIDGIFFGSCCKLPVVEQNATTTRRSETVEAEDTTIIWVNTNEQNATSLVYVIDETNNNVNKTTESAVNVNIEIIDNKFENVEQSTIGSTSSLPKLETTFEPVSSSRPLMTTSSIDDIVPITNHSSVVTSTLPTLLSLTTNSLDETINMSDYRDICGRRLTRKKRIVGGKTSQYGDWPWQLSLMVYNRDTNTFLHKCGAILVKETWAVTAAHCVQFDEAQNVLLRIGDYDLSNEDEPHSLKFVEVKYIELHRQFDRKTYEYDIALLRFKEPIQFQPNIVPICIPDSDDDFVGRTAFAIGWGRLRLNGPIPSIINQIELPIISNKECMSMYRQAGFAEYIPEIFICAGRKEGEADSCEGDSGGPLALRRPDNRFLLAGIISWGIDCGKPNQPGVYVRVSYFREWINQIIQF